MRVTLSPTVKMFGSEAPPAEPADTAPPQSRSAPVPDPEIPEFIEAPPPVAATSHDATFTADPQASLEPSLQAWLAPITPADGALQDGLTDVDARAESHGSQPSTLLSPQGEASPNGVPGDDTEQFIDALFAQPEPARPGSSLGVELALYADQRRNDPLHMTIAPFLGRNVETPLAFDRAALEQGAREALSVTATSTGSGLRIVIDIAAADVSGMAPDGALELRFDPKFANCDPVFVALDREVALGLARRILGLDNDADLVAKALAATGPAA